jgi:hypothetical protein
MAFIRKNMKAGYANIKAQLFLPPHLMDETLIILLLDGAIVVP